MSHFEGTDQKGKPRNARRSREDYKIGERESWKTEQKGGSSRNLKGTKEYRRNKTLRRTGVADTYRKGGGSWENRSGKLISSRPIKEGENAR